MVCRQQLLIFFDPEFHKQRCSLPENDHQQPGNLVGIVWKIRTDRMDMTDMAAAVGMVTGSLGFGLSILTYMKSRRTTESMLLDAQVARQA